MVLYIKEEYTTSSISKDSEEGHSEVLWVRIQGSRVERDLTAEVYYRHPTKGKT